MDWDHARIFLAVARSGQFLAAAKALRLDHATVMRRIGRLEADLGTRLLDRRTTGCTPTAAGERFLAAAERLEAEMLHVQADLAAQDVVAAGTVRVGAPDGFGTLFLTPRLAGLMERHPGLTLQLAPLPRTFSLSKREADIAVTMDRPEAGRLAVRKLTDYTLHLYAAPAYLAAHGAPETVADLPRHPLVTYVQDLVYSDALDFMPDAFGPAFRRFECASAVAQGAAVRAGAGIGILHDYAVRDDAGFELVLPDVVFRRSYWLVTHADTRDLMRVRVVAEAIAAAVGSARELFCREGAAAR